MATSSASKKVKRAIELTELLLYTQQQVPSFSPQCFLLEKAGDFQRAIEKGDIKISGPGGTAGGKKRPVPVRQLGINLDTKPARGEPSNLKYVQKITRLQRNSYESYFKYTPADIAQMVHYMSVTEALTDKKGKTKQRAIMNTERNLRDIKLGNVNTILRENAIRHGAGIESINVDFVGIDSFTKKQVVLTAKFFFQDIKTMLSDPYASLFKLETSRGSKGNEKFRTIDFHIGWNSANSKIKKEIEKLNLTIRTHLVKYSFDVRQDGSIIVDATYRGYYIEGFSGPQANLLEIAKTRYLQIKERQDEISARAAKIKTRNRRNVGDFELRNFVLTRLQAQFDKKIAPLGKVFAADTDVENLLSDVKNETLTAITTEIIGDSGKQKLFLNSSELALPAADKASAIRTKVRDPSGEISKIIDSTLNLGSNLSAASDFVAAGVDGKKKLQDEVGKSITDQMNASKKALSTSQSNIKNAAATAFDEQTRLASLARLKALQTISEKLVSSGDIKYAKIPRDVVRNFKLGAASASKVNVQAALAQPPMNSPASYVSDNLRITEDDFNNENFQIVPFVFLGNLIENMLNVPARYTQSTTGYIPDPKFTVYNLMKQAGSDVKIDLGLLSYNAPFTGNRIVNLKLYYLPISLTELNNFFARVVLAKGKTFYSFNEFLNDLLKKFLTGIFSACSKESNSRGLGAPKVETTIGDLPEKGKRTTQYFIHGAKDTINDLLKSGITRGLFGKYRANLRASIPHFFVFGRTAGIEKNIKLSDIADDQLKTAVYYSPRSSLVNDIKGNDQLKRTGFIPAVFQTEIETIGFPIMNLGQLIYVDLKPTIGKELAKSRPFDASGYYGVHKVSHSITKDSFSTNISAILQISDKDKDIVKEGGLGNLTGDTEGVKAGKFIPTSGAGAVTTAWASSGAASGTTAGSTPAPAKTTPPPEILEISVSSVGAKTDADVISWVDSVKVGVAKGFASTEFISKARKNPELGLEAFLSDLPDKTAELPRAMDVAQFGIVLDDYFGFTKGSIPGIIPGAETALGVDTGTFLGTLVKKNPNYTAEGKKKILQKFKEFEKSGQLEELRESMTEHPGFLIIREYGDGEVEVKYVEVG